MCAGHARDARRVRTPARTSGIRAWRDDQALDRIRAKLRWLRRLARRPVMVLGCEGVEDKPLRDCTDGDVRAIVAFLSHRVLKRPELEKLFGEDWWLRTVLEEREWERNPFEGEGFFPLLGLAWWRLESKAARRSSAARRLFRLRLRISDRLRRDADEWGFEEEPGDTQMALGGSAFGPRPLGRDSAQ
jgi:hypothetical protein